MNIQTFNISLPKLLVKKTDAVAKKEYKSRSELIREALRTYLKENYEWDNLFKFGQIQAQKLGINGEKEIDNLVANYRHGK